MARLALIGGLAVLLLPVVSELRAEAVRVYLVAGQSNADGRASAAGLAPPLADPLASVPIFYDDEFSSDGARWQALRPGMCGGYGQSTIGSSLFGPELAFGHCLRDSMPDDPIAIIKYAYGGTDLDVEWNPGVDADTQGLHFANFLSTVQAGLASMAPDDVPIFAGMIWMQGEADAASSVMSQRYEENLTNLILAVREEFNAPYMPFAIGQIANAKPYTYGFQIQQAQYNVSQTTPYASLVVTSDLGLNSDNVHYNAPGQQALGQRFADEIRLLSIHPPGDADGNNMVDASDAAILAAHWGESGEWFYGDFNDDGLVGPADASILAANWGHGTSESTTVPEPGILTIMILGASTLLWRRPQSNTD
ncbi:MAG TPA: sialate O-acetylesterase [Thermoguttaceae bacterium]|nr:sialate O-acetylesterase [Thermoguttaceae bacterium]